jgi:AAA+ ATPase superfamily predicted ATPase
MINLIPGGVPTGENLFGRDELISDLWRKLEQDNILLLAPRRFGKTGIMRKMQDEPRNGFAVVFLDCEKIRDPESFLVELIFEFLKDSRARTTLKTAKYLPGKMLSKATKTLKEIELWKLKVAFREGLGHN